MTSSLIDSFCIFCNTETISGSRGISDNKAWKGFMQRFVVRGKHSFNYGKLWREDISTLSKRLFDMVKKEALVQAKHT